MIQKVKNGLKKREVRLFFVFLCCSFFAWLINNLSETYSSNTTFDLNFVGIPDDKILINASATHIDVRLQAVGFQFLRFNLKPKKIALNLSDVKQANGKYFVTRYDYQNQIEEQLSNSMRLLHIVGDTLFFDMQDLIEKEIDVQPDIDISFGQNHLLDGALMVIPPKIRVKGPANEVAKISVLKTDKISLQDLNNDFSETTLLVIPDSLLYTSYSQNKIKVSGKVSRFSEKIIKMRVQVINLPDHLSIRTFPDEIEVLCKAKVSDLKKLSTSDFKLIADYNEVNKNENTNTLSLSIQNKPKGLFDAIMSQNSVEYILKNK